MIQTACSGSPKSWSDARGDQELMVEIDIRYAGQAFEVPLSVPLGTSIAELVERFDTEHKRLFTFNLPVPQELVNIRVVALGTKANVSAQAIERGDGDPAAARLYEQDVWMDGRTQSATIYDRAKLRAGDKVRGPAVVTEMDATTLVRTAMSPGIREQGDAFPLIADPDGKMIVGQFGSFIDGFCAGSTGRSRRAT